VPEPRHAFQPPLRPGIVRHAEAAEAAPAGPAEQPGEAQQEQDMKQAGQTLRQVGERDDQEQAEDA
jgi:hypothetical protein